MEPLPPVKEVEYRCYIGKVFEELSGTEFMTFAFETAKEFSSFRYEIAVRYRIQPGLLEFKVLGMTATRTMMPAFGTARSVLKVPLLPLGVYTVKLIKSDDTENIFTIEVSKKGFQILLPIPRKRFIDVVIEDKAAAPNARHVSTVSKAPPTPLVPRTIQKRAPGMLDGESSEYLDAPEEQEVDEEEALFGESTKPKSGAKHVIDEIEEVPETVKLTAKAEPKPEAKTEAKADVKPAKASKATDKAPVAKAKADKPKKAEAKPAKAAHAPAKVAKKPAAKAKASAPAKKAAPKKKPAPKPKASPKAKPAKKSGKKK
jgi:hypothetical protein